MQMRPLSQLAAALARRGRGACGPGCALPHTAHISGSGDRARAPRSSTAQVRLRRVGVRCGPWQRTFRAAQAANFGGVRAAPSPPARRARPFIECLRCRPRPPPPPPGGPSRSERPRAGLRPGAFVSPRPIGRRTACAPRRPADCLWSSAAGRRAAQLARPFRLRCPCLRTFSPGSCPLRGVLRRPARLRGSRPERSAHARVAGLRQDQLSGSEAARAARLLPSLRSPPLCCPPPSSGPHRLLSARPARRHH